MKLRIALVIPSVLLGGCFLFFHLGEYEDLLSSLDDRRNNRLGDPTGWLVLELSVYGSASKGDASGGFTKSKTRKEY